MQMPISNIRGAYGYRNVLITERGYVGMISSNNTDSAGGGIPLHGEERKKVERQFTKENGKIIISVKWKYPFIKFTVWDNGVGISACDLNSITSDLENFEKVMTINKKIGLGLITTGKIV